MEIRPILSALMRNKTGPLLVAIQVALSLAILANALHIVELRRQVVARPSGIDDESSVFIIRARTLAEASYEEQLANRERELAALRSVPGVISASQIIQAPLTHSGNSNSVTSDRQQQNANAATYESVGGLVKTWGLKVVEGRDFTPDEYMNVDTRTSDERPHVVMITRALAEKLFPGQPAAGKTMYFGAGENARAVRIVGVIERLQTPWVQVGERAEFSTIAPVRTVGSTNGAMYSVRTERGQLDRVMRDAEAALRGNSVTSMLIEAKPMEKIRDECYRGDRTLSWMLIVVSGLLLLVTVSGIVGMASLWVTQRRKQIGVRRALGARRVDILRYFITENVIITSSGVFCGVLLALALNHLLVSKLEMQRLPAGYLLAGAGLFWALGIAAVYGPAWRAASISPALATRTA